jgi:hypothetical protein
MRQWMVDPKILCRKHLMGEHVEHHMMVGTINKRKSITGYINNNLIEPLSLIGRHVELVIEMEERGYNHKSDLPVLILNYLPENELNYKIDKEKSLNDLINRCEDCKERYFRYKNE